MPLDGEYAPSPRDRSREHVELYEGSGGTDGTSSRGMPVVVLTSRGAKTGKLRKTPLMKVEHDGVYAIVASLGGADVNPLWYRNVMASPQVELQDGTTRFDAVVREVHGAEYVVWWERAVAAFPDYADYQTRTERKIPVLLVEQARP